MQRSEDCNSIGNVLLRRGSITKRQLKKVLKEQNKRSVERVGDLAIELGFVSACDVDAALHEQKLFAPPQKTDTEILAVTILKDAFALVAKEADKISERHRKHKQIALLQDVKTGA